MINRESILFCLCGPSGVGKSTISLELLKGVPELVLSISATTRPPRAGEKEGIHYYYKTRSQFEEEIARNEFLEWAIYNDQYYGTPLRNLREAQVKGLDLLLDIDVQGAKALREKAPGQTVVIFISAPSFSELQQRLVARASDTLESQAKRLHRAQEEQRLLSQPEVSDYLVVNSELSLAVEACQRIISAERMRLSRYTPAYRRRLSGL
jgi:guanylate kinase